jgi:hypothetical protein
MWAYLVYDARGSSGSAPGDETFLYDSLGARRAEIMRMLGWRRPVTA